MSLWLGCWCGVFLRWGGFEGFLDAVGLGGLVTGRGAAYLVGGRS